MGVSVAGFLRASVGLLGVVVSVCCARETTGVPGAKSTANNSARPRKLRFIVHLSVVGIRLPGNGSYIMPMQWPRRKRLL